MFEVNLGGEPANHASFYEPAHPLGDCIGREADSLGQVFERETGIVFERAENIPVNSIDHGDFLGNRV